MTDSTTDGTALRTAHRICPLCEAACGLEITLDGDRVTKVRGNPGDVFSKGFICPKGAALGALDEDPDKLTAPLLRRPDGGFDEVSWPEAFAAVERGLTGVVERHGREAVAYYYGNAVVHTIAIPLFLEPLRRALGTRNVYAAASVDTVAKNTAAGLMYGDPWLVPVPDVDRTDYLLVLGANPMESNGSLLTAPDLPGRLRALRERGGRLVVVDPRRTRTAELADRHVPIRPGTDAYLLFAMVSVLFAEGLAVDPGERFAGVERVRELAAGFSPEAVAEVCGVPAEVVRELARELAAAPSAAVYARIGTCTAEFGTLANWLVDVLNVLTGNLDRPGGAMFGTPPHVRPRPAEPFTTGRWHSRVRGLPEVMAELPVATLADEIETPGEGQVRALVEVAGNLVLAAPNGERLDRALAGLEFMVSVDPYLNETTRHADVILPPPRVLQSPHYDVVLSLLSVRRVARVSPALLPLPADRPSESEILARIALIAAGHGAGADPATVDEAVIDQILAAVVSRPGSPFAGVDPAVLKDKLDGDSPTERRLDLMLRLGPFGDAFGARPGGVSLRMLAENPDGVDFGPLEPRLGEVLATASGLVELCPDPIAADVERLRAGLTARRPDRDGFVLIGRRQLRSVNSWSHNVPALLGGTNRCTLHLNTADAERLGVGAGDRVRVTGPAGEVVVAAEPVDGIMPGVVSLPHGWGHGRAGTRMPVAAAEPGVSINALTDDAVVDPLSGSAVFNGVPVRVSPLG